MQTTNEFRQSSESRTELLVCPQCHEKSLHVHSVGHYQCIFCDFERNLSDPITRSVSNGLIAIGLSALVVFGGIYLTTNKDLVRELIQTNKTSIR